MNCKWIIIQHGHCPGCAIGVFGTNYVLCLRLSVARRRKRKLKIRSPSMDTSKTNPTTLVSQLSIAVSCFFRDCLYADWRWFGRCLRLGSAGVNNLHHFRFWLAQFLAAGRRAELEQIMPRHESTRTELHPVVTTNKDEYALGIRSVCIHSENPFSENCAFESNLFATNCIMPFPFVWCKIFGSDTKW